MAYGDFKDLAKRTAADKVLRYKAFNIAKDPKYDGYQRGLVSMVYKFFDKKAADSGIKSMPQNEQLAEELHKSIIRKFKKINVYSTFKDKIWGADLADMQLISKFNKGFRIYVLLIFLVNMPGFSLKKDKKGISIVNAFQSNFKNLIENQIRYGQTMAVNFITILLKNGYKTMILLCIQHIIKENLLLLKDLLRH